jgi:RNA 2',3'-cyclic 3'-phosphodiesterase
MNAEPRLRLFVAVEIPQGVRRAVDAAATPLQRRASDAKWTSPAQWHLTLAFLGWVDADRLAAGERACAAAAAGVAPFELKLDGIAGTFGGRVLWAGLEDAPGLEALALHVREELAAAGFEVEERPFRAHLTLARARRGGRLPRGLAEEYQGPTARWTVDRLVLMRSRLQRGGARYSIEAAWRL